MPPDLILSLWLGAGQRPALGSQGCESLNPQDLRSWCVTVLGAVRGGVREFYANSLARGAEHTHTFEGEMTSDRRGMFSSQWEMSAPHLAAPHSLKAEWRGACLFAGPAVCTGRYPTPTPS